MKDELKQIGKWNFNTIKLEQLTSFNALRYLGEYILVKKGFAETYSIGLEEMKQFLQCVNDTYMRSNHYHNATHGADVTNSSLFIAENGLP